MSQERRRSQRIAVQQAVFITLENGGRRCTGIAENVSSGGVFLYSDYFIPAGTEVRLTLVLPPEITHGENVRVWWVGKILRVDPEQREGKFGIAIGFEQLQVLPQA